MLKIDNISLAYDGKEALKNVSFEVEKGELFGLIGPDGAGKTSLFRILTTLILPDSGSAFLNNIDVVEDYKYVRRNVGYMPGKFSLYQDLSVRENLEFFAQVMNTSIEENRHLIDDIYRQLEPFEKRRAGALSGGMKQKLALSCALIHRPKMLFLDEPTTGVDAVSRAEFWEMLRNLKKENISILVSTPYMDESNLCDRVALIQEGQILEIDKPDRIVSKFKKSVYALESDQLYGLLVKLRKEDPSLGVYPFGDSLHAYFQEDASAEDYLAARREIYQMKYRKIEAGIEDVFMNLMTTENDE